MLGAPRLASRDSKETYEKLAEAERTQKRLTGLGNKKTLRVDEISLAADVFQWRGEASNLLAEEDLVRSLRRVLELGHELEPVDVTAIGGRYYLIDGHHRYAAYVVAGRKQVPIRYFDGNLNAAHLLSLKRNIKDKLPMSRADKTEAAFTLVKHKMRGTLKGPGGEDMTWKNVADETTVSERLVYKMRAVLAETPDAFERSWAATMLQTKHTEEDEEPYADVQGRKLAEQFMKLSHINFVKNPDVLAKALEAISEALPRALLEQWWGHAFEVLAERAEELGDENDAEALRRMSRRVLEL